jgi:predicted GNAT family acetyltransferase
MGCAKTCTSDLSGPLLGRGCVHCCLMTDLAKPIPNQIYPPIGDLYDIILSK